MTDSLELLFIQLLVFEEIEDEELGGVAEEAADEVADGGATGLVAADDGLVNEGAGFFGLGVGDVPFVFQDAERGEDGVVGESEVFGEGLVDLGDGGGASVPEDVHEPELGFGEVRGSFACQRLLLQLRN
jgi:hypothetical protein